MKKRLNKKHDYKTIVKIKLASEVLRQGFWMGDLVDFLEGNAVKIQGNRTNSSKFYLARLSLEAVKSHTKLVKIFKEILNNKFWYYEEPKEALKKLSQATKLTLTKKKQGSKFVLSFTTCHPIIRKVSKKLFMDGHYSQAIFEAYKAVVNKVKKISKLYSLDGKPLMENAFSLNKPKIKLNELRSRSEKDEQLGFMLLFSGAALGIRNPKAHENVYQDDPIRALEYLSFASLLLKRLDERIKEGKITK